MHILLPVTLQGEGYILMNRCVDDQPPKAHATAPQKPANREQRILIIFMLVITCVTVLSMATLRTMGVIFSLLHVQASSPASDQLKHHFPTVPARPFDPNVGAILPTHRVVAFYAIPHAEATE